MAKKSASEYVDVSSSGGVSVRLGGYLKSTDGKGQLRDIRALRDFTRQSGDRMSAPRKVKR